MSSTVPASRHSTAFLDPRLDVLRSFRTHSYSWSPIATDAIAFRDTKFKKFHYRAPILVPAFDAHYDEHVTMGSRPGNDNYFSVEEPVFNHSSSRVKNVCRGPIVEEPPTFQSEFLKWFFVFAVLMTTGLGFELLSYVFGGIVSGVAIGLVVSCIVSYGKKWLQTEDEFQI